MKKVELGQREPREMTHSQIMLESHSDYPWHVTSYMYESIVDYSGLWVIQLVIISTVPKEGYAKVAGLGQLFIDKPLSHKQGRPFHGEWSKVFTVAI